MPVQQGEGEQRRKGNGSALAAVESASLPAHRTAPWLWARVCGPCGVVVSWCRGGVLSPPFGAAWQA